MAEVEENVKRMFESISKRGPVWKSMVLWLTLLANLYVLVFLENLESPWTAAWFYVNAIFMTYMIVAPTVGLRFPKIQMILIAGFVMAMFTQFGLIFAGPIILRNGAGDAALFLLAIWCTKFIIFIF